MIMKEIIGIKVNEIVSRYVDFYLAEAVTETYPYAVYTNDVTPFYTKDGLHHYESNVVITIYAQDLDKADKISDQIQEAITAGMRNGQFSARLVSSYPDCVEGVWSRELSYTIKQFR